MRKFTKEQLDEIINSNKFEELIGKFENEWFDCKNQPYQLNEIKNKRELAKDVTSFANSDGGYILIGIKTKPDESHFGDKIEEIRPFTNDLISAETIAKVCEEWIYPKPDGLEISWILLEEETNKGIAIIKIPKQSESIKPFLIKNVLEGDRQIETMFGYVERRRDNSQPFSLRDIQTILRSGLNYERNMRNRFDALELVIQGTTKESIRDNFREKVDERIKIALTKRGLINDRNFVLAGYIEGEVKIKRLPKRDEIREALSKATEGLRNQGWTLLSSPELETYKPDLIETELARRGLSLYSDGTAIYACSINRISIFENPSVIIPIALIELIYQYVEFYKRILSYIDESFERFVLRIELNNLNNEKLVTKLPLKLLYQHQYPINDAPDVSMKKEIAEDKEFDSSILTYKIIKEIYEWFEFVEEPQHTKINENGVGKIAIEELTRS